MTNGIIKNWNDKKGYGFIIPQKGGKDVFFHINNYSRQHKRPEESLKVQYTISADKNGRPCAIEVAPIKGHKNNALQNRQKFFSLLLLGVFALILYVLYMYHKIPIHIAGVYGIASIITFILYANDKSAAESGRWRTQESTLHMLSLIGGWPGAKIAQSFLRHKSKKMSFRVTYWLTVVINCAFLYWLTTPNGVMWVKRCIMNLNVWTG